MEFRCRTTWKNVLNPIYIHIHEGKTNDLLIAFIGYVNDRNKLQQCKLSVQKSQHQLQCASKFSWQQYV